MRGVGRERLRGAEKGEEWRQRRNDQKMNSKQKGQVGLCLSKGQIGKKIRIMYLKKKKKKENQ